MEKSQIESLNRDRKIAKNAIKVYLQHYLIPERNEIIEDLICDIAKEGFINADWIEIY